MTKRNIPIYIDEDLAAKIDTELNMSLSTFCELSLLGALNITDDIDKLKKEIKGCEHRLTQLQMQLNRLEWERDKK